jgi:tetratricopeptide (TPR) repeat protein
MKNKITIILLCFFVYACAVEKKKLIPEKVLPRDWLADLRAEAKNYSSAVQVIPLLDPSVADLRERALAFENKGDFVQAKQAINKAIELTPDDPDLWQSLAETHIATKDWLDADQTAHKSFLLGPKLGALCARNWLAIQAAKTELGDAVAAAKASAEIRKCKIAALKRM